jgi:hypothetical protein
MICYARLIIIAGIGLLLNSPPVFADQNYNTLKVECSYARNQENESSIKIAPDIDTYLELSDRNTIQTAINNLATAAWQELYNQCINDPVFSRWQNKHYVMWLLIVPPSPYVEVFGGDYFGVMSVAKELAYDTRQITMKLIHNQIPQNVSMYNQKKAQDQVEEERRRRIADATKDCGPSPNVTGGPLFSPTYKIGATDAASRSGLLCVKEIQYVGPAVNPFGGNAARAKFIGYDQQTGNSVSVIRDFPY